MPRPEGRRLITGGEDGKVVLQRRRNGRAGRRGRQEVGHQRRGRAAGDCRLCGGQERLRALRRRQAAGNSPIRARSKGLPSAPARHAPRRRPLQRRDIALPRGRRASRPNCDGTGAHTGITFSPDGNFLVTTMQENALHGWKLADAKHMRMTGYPAKVKSLSWSAKGKWLASSGAPGAIVWPFQGKDGPMGKAPIELGTRGDTMVTCVACHPSQDDRGNRLCRRHDHGGPLRRRQGSAAAPSGQGRRSPR